MKAFSKKSYLLISAFTVLLSLLIIAPFHLLIDHYPLITKPLTAQERPFSAQTQTHLEQRNAFSSDTTELNPANNPRETTSKPQAKLETMRGGRHEKYYSIVFQFSDEFRFSGPRIRRNEMLLKLRDVVTKLRPFRKYKTFDSWVELKKAGHDLNVQVGLPHNFTKPHVFLMENPHRLVINLYFKEYENVPPVYSTPASEVESPRRPSKAKDISKPKEFLWEGDEQPNLRDFSKAKQLSRDGDYGAAKAIYERLLNKNPKDIEAAIGLATVTAWSGDYDKARQLYERILKKQPDNKVALLGLGRVLSWQQEYSQSLKTLEQLLLLYPGDQEALVARDSVLRAKEAKRQFKVRIGYDYQDLSFTSNAYGANFLIGYDEQRKWGIRAGFDYIDKFGESTPGYRLGGSYWVADNTAISFDAELAPDQDVVPREAYTFEVSRAIFKTFVPSLSYRFAHYSTVDAHIVMPGFTWYFYPRFNWMVRYFLSISQFNEQNFVKNSGMTRLNWDVFDPVTLFAGYARANESFESGNPINPYGAFSADHFFGGFKWEIYKGVGFDFTFDYEERNNGFIIKTVNTAMFYRW